MKINDFTEREIRSLQFYQGCVGLDVPDNLETFYGTSKAYMTLNMLMYDGIENEETRIFKEGHQLSPHLFYNVKEIIAVYEDILSIMSCSLLERNCEEKNTLVTYRTERAQAFNLLKKGYTVSLTSTSKVNLEIEYFRKKEGLVILEFNIPSNIPYIDVNAVLGKENKYYGQQEILLPPFVKVSLKNKELSVEERNYRDINNNPPVGKYEVDLTGELLKGDFPADERMKQEAYLMDEKRISNAVNVIESMNKGQKVERQKVDDYVNWKNSFRELIGIIFSEKFSMRNPCSKLEKDMNCSSKEK